MVPNVKYKKIATDDSTAIYGIYDRHWLLGTCTEQEIRNTLEMCEKELNGDRTLGYDYSKSLKRLRDSLLEALEVA